MFSYNLLNKKTWIEKKSKPILSMPLVDYTRGAKLGEGGYGKVYKYKQSINNRIRTLAVKIAPIALENPLYSVCIFLFILDYIKFEIYFYFWIHVHIKIAEEANKMRTLVHPNIVEIIESFIEGGK